MVKKLQKCNMMIQNSRSLYRNVQRHIVSWVFQRKNPVIKIGLSGSGAGGGRRVLG